ncbi:MAG: hypothetical protein GX561_09595 [Lentisphaerae bacterium]|jgi:perosamine synthetase|nr:hypothetical protein [Lentisphaerota bacterium]
MSNRLALCGGKPVIEALDKELTRWPIITEEDVAAVSDVVRCDGKASATDITRAFESEWASYNGVRFALGVCNGTAGLAEALWALGVGAGDEVISPSLTYWATCAPALQLGASIRFADIDPVSLCLDVADVERKLSPKTKVICAVNYAGYPADWDGLRALASSRGIGLLEDNSHGHGSMYGSRMCGSLGDIAAASMMSSKGFAIGEAGMITTDREDLYQRCIAYGHYERTFASKYSDALEGERLPELVPFSGIPIGGCKHRMNQMCSALGRVQLKHYPERLQEVDRAMNALCDILDSVPCIRSHRPPEGSGLTKGAWYFPLARYDSSKLGGVSLATFSAALRAEGFGAYPGANAPLHRHPYFKDLDYFRQGTPTVRAFGQESLDDVNCDAMLPETVKTIGTIFRITRFTRYDKAVLERHRVALEKVVSQVDALLDWQKSSNSK